MKAPSEAVLWGVAAIALALGAWVMSRALLMPVALLDGRQATQGQRQREQSSTHAARGAERNPLGGGTSDPFKIVNFIPAPTPAQQVIVETPPPPRAPAFPFRYFGRMAGPDGQMQTYLVRDDALFMVKPKEMLGSDYRVESMSEGEIVVVYVPLEEKTVVVTRASE